MASISIWVQSEIVWEHPEKAQAAVLLNASPAWPVHRFMLFLVDNYHKELLPEPGEAVRELNAPNPSQARTPHTASLRTKSSLLVTAQEAEALFLGRNGLVGATVSASKGMSASTTSLELLWIFNPCVWLGNI